LEQRDGIALLAAPSAFFIEPQRAQRAQSKKLFFYEPQRAQRAQSKKRDRHRESSFFMNHKGHREHRARARARARSAIASKHSIIRVNANHPDLEFNPEQVDRTKMDEQFSLMFS
jgi:hypothetical protein